MPEYLLYGVRNGDEDWQEEILLSGQPNRDKFEKVKQLATADGWGRFREATFTPGERPDFSRVLSR